MKKDEWKDYFSFTRKERIAVGILLLLIIVFIVLPWFIPSKETSITVDKETEDKIAQLSSPGFGNDSTAGKEESPAETVQSKEKQDKPAGILFYFDPNTLDEAGWKKLGLQDKTIRTILNYRNKGGRFYHPEDIGKIYGLGKEDAARLIPYIQIAGKEKNQQAVSKPPGDSLKVAKEPSVKIKILHINTATVEEWKALPGIGDVLGNRIIKFRNKINGFKSIDQVGKTYGLTDSVFQTIKPYLVLD